MSENETPTPPPFAPFLPDAPPLQPEQPVAGKKKRANKKPKADTYKVDYAEELAKNVTAEKKKRRKPAPEKRLAKYDLQTILKVAAALKEGDQKVFEKLLGELSDLPKGSRIRVLKALGEVFG